MIIGEVMDNNAVSFVFKDAEQALVWSAEVLRRRRLPALSKVWDEVLAEAEFVARAWEGEKLEHLPSSPLDRLDLALKVERALDTLSALDNQAALLLRLWAWGDWADEARLRRALAMQEKLRREGVRVRVSYRYSYSQLGILLGCDKKVAWRRVQDALGRLDSFLAAGGLVQLGGFGVRFGEHLDNFKKDVQIADFKRYDEDLS